MERYLKKRDFGEDSRNQRHQESARRPPHVEVASINARRWTDLFKAVTIGVAIGKALEYSLPDR